MFYRPQPACNLQRRKKKTTPLLVLPADFENFIKIIFIFRISLGDCFFVWLEKPLIAQNPNHCTQSQSLFSIMDFFSNSDKILKLRICSHLLKKSLMENFMFCAVNNTGALFALALKCVELC